MSTSGGGGDDCSRGSDGTRDFEGDHQLSKKPKLEGEIEDVMSDSVEGSSDEDEDNSGDESDDVESGDKNGCKEQLRKEPKTTKIEDNVWFGKNMEDEELMSGWSKVWEEGGTPDKGEHLRVYQTPFRHAEIMNFVSNTDFIEGFKTLFNDLEFKEKSSDLFQFFQSYDLNSIVDPFVYSISQYLHEKVLPFMKRLTGLPLNQTIDMFLSTYRQTDFLLCHDDELDSRRIAFIWYLSDEWLEDYGGTLDLFSATESLHPDKIVKKIVPEFNKFVFFEVGVTSFHQVSEVLQKLKEPRLALSGWFYGDRLPRPLVNYPNENISSNVLDTCKDFSGILKKLCNDDYLIPQMHKELNDMLCKDSQLFIPSFLKYDVYKTICESIIENDVTDSNFFQQRGPINMQNFQEAIAGPPEITSSGLPADQLDSSNEPITNIHSLRNLFYSKEFLGFLESVTEFPFTTLDTNRMVASLQKFSHGSFQLMKPGLVNRVKHSLDEEVGNGDEDGPNYVEILLYFAHKWAYDWGGEEVYCSVDGEDAGDEQLMSIHPDGNSMAVVVRTGSVVPFTKYVNCLAKDDVYFVYKIKYAFDGNF